MKTIETIIEKINEGKCCHLFSEVQNDVDKTGEYHTYKYEDGKKKFKKGFIYFNTDDEFIGIQAFNKSSEFEDLLGVDPGTYKELDTALIGEEVDKIDDCKMIRIW